MGQGAKEQRTCHRPLIIEFIVKKLCRDKDRTIHRAAYRVFHNAKWLKKVVSMETELVE